MKLKVRTRKRILKFALIAFIIVLIVAAAVPWCLRKEYRNFETLNDCAAWLSRHSLNYNRDEFNSWAEYLQVEALKDGYLISVQIARDEEAAETHIGLLVDIDKDYYYFEVNELGLWKVIKLASGNK